MINLINAALLFFRHVFQLDTTDKTALFIPYKGQIAASHKNRVPRIPHSLKMFGCRIVPYGITETVMGNSQKCLQGKRQFNPNLSFKFFDFLIRNHGRNQFPFLPFFIRICVVAPHFFFIFLERKRHADFVLRKLLIILFKKISHVFLILDIGHFNYLRFYFKELSENNCCNLFRQKLRNAIKIAIYLQQLFVYIS